MSTYSAPRGPRAHARFAAPPAHQSGVVWRGRADSGRPGDVQPALGFDAHELVVGLWAMLVLFGRGPVLLGGGLAACAMGVVVRQRGDDCWPSSAVWTSCLSVRR
jgi:hypothetical protein